jgi:hypothetical protein
MVAQDGIAGLAAVVGWSESLGDLHARIAHRFARSEARERWKEQRWPSLKKGRKRKAGP